ncbi:hypothetical protein B0A66_15500 [Flavobacterium hercynium]|uniref:Suppressor of fused-like domain-containing protein n=2 Tax=Flavobacterium hercynium TaxID=387094 RepID=A0A226H265_9FLAO|nr:hypothetical protein B0A66_15500 [Flavobacterium hercynium]
MYLNHLDNIFQQEPVYIMGEKDENGLQGVSVMMYKDVPEQGFITGITYGLSLVEHPEWKLGRQELCISVESTDENWAKVIGFVAEKLRGDCPFLYEQTINFREQISKDSEMDAFFVFAPSTLDRDDYLNIDIGLDYKINIAGFYPIYSSEIEVIEKIGLKDFWHHPNFDNYAVNRERIKDQE